MLRSQAESTALWDTASHACIMIIAVDHPSVAHTEYILHTSEHSLMQKYTFKEDMKNVFFTMFLI